MSSTAFTDPQLDAIMSAKEDREDLATLSSLEVAARLRAEGHPAWAGAEPKHGQPFLASPARAQAGGLNLPPARPLPSAAPAPAPEPAPMVPAAPQAPMLPARAGSVSEGAECLDQDDIKIPRLALQQNTSDGDSSEVPPGHWALSSDPDGASEARELLILDVQKWRELLFPYKKEREAEQLRQDLARNYGLEVPEDRACACRSTDRVAPVDQGWGVVARLCAECPYSRWERIRGKPVPPQCGELYRLLVLDCATGLPAFVRFRGSAIAPAKNLFTLLKIRAKRHPLFPGRDAPFAAFRVEFRGKEEHKQSKYWVPVLKLLSPVTDEAELEVALAMRRAIVGAPNVVEEGAEVEPAAEEVGA